MIFSFLFLNTFRGISLQWMLFSKRVKVRQCPCANSHALVPMLTTSRAKERSCRRLNLQWEQRPGDATPRYRAGLQARGDYGLPLTAQRLRFSLLGGGGKGEGWGMAQDLCWALFVLSLFFYIFNNRQISRLYHGCNLSESRGSICLDLILLSYEPIHVQ